MFKNNTCYSNNDIYNDFDFDYHSYKSLHPQYSIRANTAINIVRAFDFAKYIGIPLNNFVTINLFNIDQFAGRLIFSRIRERINRWLKRLSLKLGKNFVPTWVFVFENPLNLFHVHWCINIPDELKNDFRKKVRQLLEKHQGQPILDNQLNFQDMNPYTDKTLANYLCKGIRPNYIGLLHLQKRAAFQGHIIGQRARVSRNLGPTAIKKANFNATLQRYEWSERHPHIADKYEKPENWDINEVIPQATGAKTFPEFQEYWKQIMREKSYFRNGLGYNRNINGSIPRTYAEQTAKMEKIKQQLNYTI